MKKVILFCVIALSFCLNANSQNKVMVINGTSDWVDTGYNFNGFNPGFVFASGYVIRNDYSDSFDNYATPAGRAFSKWPSNSFPCQTCNATSFIGKIGVNGTPFLIGERAYINGFGRLYLTINDTPLYDNRGAFVAVIYKNVTQIASNSLNRSFEQQIVDEFGPQLDTKKTSDIETDFTFYPNPASNSVTVKMLNVQDKTSIGDINGNPRWSGSLDKKNQAEIVIPTLNLTKGVYLLSIVINGETKGKKLVIE